MTMPSWHDSMLWRPGPDPCEVAILEELSQNNNINKQLTRPDPPKPKTKQNQRVVTSQDGHNPASNVTFRLLKHHVPPELHPLSQGSQQIPASGDLPQAARLPPEPFSG